MATLVAWVLVTFLGARLLTPPDTSLDELVSHGIAWQILAAGLLLVAVIRWRGWRDLRFGAATPGTLHLLVFPALLLALLLAGAAFLGLPAASIVILVAINSLLVGFSEETMFRGVLFRALEERLAIWPAILLTTVAFGLVHVLNGFITGEFGAAVTQAVVASCSGLLLMAILLRTGSLWAAILFHGLWDWATFLLALAANANAASTQAATPPAADGSTLLGTLAPFIMVLPGNLYALWLLRHVHRMRPAGDN